MPIDWDKLPEEIKHNPAVLHSRLTRLEHEMTEWAAIWRSVQTPLGKVPWPVVLFVLSVVLYWKPEIIASYFGQ